jgi:hypothetical protein
VQSQGAARLDVLGKVLEIRLLCSHENATTAVQIYSNVISDQLKIVSRAGPPNTDLTPWL